MLLLIAIFVGILIGAAVGYFLMENVETLFISSIVGLAGSILATGVYALAAPDLATERSTTLAGLLVAAIGALIAALIFAGMQKMVPKRAGSPPGVKQSDADVEDERRS